MPIAPNYDPQYFQQAQNSFQQAAEAAMPTTQLRDTAASRIRSRLAGAGAAQNMQLQDSFAARGRANSGAYQGAQMQQNAAQQGALATGLADNEMNYLKARQEGANVLRGVGEGYNALGKSSGDLQIAQQQANTDQAFSEGRLAVERGTLDENIQKRQAEQVIESLKTFGQYGNVAGQKNYSEFANAIKDILGRAGIRFDPTGFTAPTQGSGTTTGGTTGGTTTTPTTSAPGVLAADGATYSVGALWRSQAERRPPPAISPRSGFGWVRQSNGNYILQRL
jgi:hypothetical protein